MIADPEEGDRFIMLFGMEFFEYFKASDQIFEYFSKILISFFNSLSYITSIAKNIVTIFYNSKSGSS